MTELMDTVLKTFVENVAKWAVKCGQGLFHFTEDRQWQCSLHVHSFYCLFPHKMK